MKALILSAGRGRRLWPFTADAPKCLLPVGGGDILGHQLETLRDAGVSQVVLVCGHGLHRMQQRVAKLPAGISVRLIFNPFFSVSDNLVSLWAARAEMDQGFILSNGDNVFHPDILKPLLAAGGDCCLLAQRKGLYKADDMKVQVTGDRVTRIGKSLVGPMTHAESIGIMKFSEDGAYKLRRALEEVVMAPAVLHRFFVDAIQHLADKGFVVNWADTGGLPWIDIDTPDDLEFAQANSHLFDATIALPAAIEGRP
jgi:choline kinase